MKKNLRADGLLLFVTLGWGISYYFVDMAMGELGVFTQNALRFLIAFFLCFLMAPKRAANLSRKTLLYSLLTGTILFVVYIGSTLGVKYTTLSNTAFLACLSVIFTPLFQFLYFRRLLSKKSLFCVLMSFVGICLLTLTEDFSINVHTLKGDLFSLMCAATYAHHLLVTEHAVRQEEVNVYALSIFQFLVCGVLNLFVAMATEPMALPKEPKTYVAILILAVCCTALTFVTQAYAQQFTSSSHVAVIFSLEPVFAGLLAYVVVGERLSPRATVGAILMALAVLLIELPWPRKKLSEVHLERKSS